MKELIQKLCRGEILRAKLEDRIYDSYELILEDPEAYIKNPDHHWRYNPNWSDRWAKESWKKHRGHSVIAQLLKDSGYSNKMKAYYKWCKEVFNDGD